VRTRGPAVVALAYGCGLATSDLIRLQTRHWRPGGVDVVEASAHHRTPPTHGMARRYRVLPTPPIVVEAVERYLDALGFQPAPEDPLPWPKGDGDLSQRIRNASRRVGFDPPLTIDVLAANFELFMRDHDAIDGMIEYVCGALPVARDVPGAEVPTPDPADVLRFCRKAHPVWRGDREIFDALRSPA